MYSSVAANNTFDDETTNNSTTKNAFSLAEKKYRLKVIETIRVDAKTGRRRKSGKLVEEIDVSETIDFDECVGHESSVVMRVSKLKEEEKKQTFKAKGGVEEVAAFSRFASYATSRERPRVWKLLDHPGAYYVQNILDLREQRELIMHCVKILPERPNKTNHWQRLGKPLPADLYLCNQSGFVFKRRGKRVDGVRDTSETRRRDGIESGETFVEEVTLGYGRGTVRLDEESLRGRASAGGGRRIKRACVKTLEIVFGKEAAFVEKEEDKFFDGQVGLANFYAPGDTLNGHVDDAEMNLSKPIASLSLGLPAIFLLGQKSKALKPVTALIVRSGDAIVLSGESRTMFHGVPRVFSDGETLMSSSKTKKKKKKSLVEIRCSAFLLVTSTYLLNFAKRTRINLSLRDVR